MKFLNRISLFSFVILIALASCSKQPDVEYTPTYKMSGEWFIKFYTGGHAVTDYHKIISYNTADPGATQIWVDDLNFQPFKAKFDVDYSTLTFKPTANISNAANTGKTIKVLEGKVISGGGKSKTGVTVDSIFMRLEFSEEPGTIYEVAGHQRTGFFEDEF
jgi:hypothetical protein